jgi:hypothetical protein
MGREDAKLLERIFFSFCQKIKDGKTGWQTVRDALTSNHATGRPAHRPPPSRSNFVDDLARALFGIATQVRQIKIVSELCRLPTMMLDM